MLPQMKVHGDQQGDVSRQPHGHGERCHKSVLEYLKPAAQRSVVAQIAQASGAENGRAQICQNGRGKNPEELVVIGGKACHPKYDKGRKGSENDLGTGDRNAGQQAFEEPAVQGDLNAPDRAWNSRRGEHYTQYYAEIEKEHQSENRPGFKVVSRPPESVADAGECVSGSRSL